MAGRPDISILGFDLRASGVVRNALRIAGAAHAAGLATELWVVRTEGPLRAEVPEGVRLREAGIGPLPRSRSLALSLALPALTSYFRQTRPAIALSSGNHLHICASLAWCWAGRPADVALWARASNAPLRHPIAAMLGRPLPGPIARFTDRVNSLQYRCFDRIIAVSHELGTALGSELGIDSSRVSVIVNGVDSTAIADQAAAPLVHQWFAPDAPPVIVAAGRLTRQKNFEDLIDALPHVRDRVPARLLILGEGAPKQRAALAERAAMRGVADAVTLQGFEANPYRFMARADLVTISSRWEGASNVALEALACGTPVVAYGCPTGITETIAPLDPSAVIPPGDVAALADAVSARLAAPMGKASTRSYAARFDLKSTLTAYVDCFRADLARRPAVSQ